MITAVRHGPTKLNDPKEDRIRGWLDVPLTDEGQRDAQMAAQALSPLRGKVHALHTSDLHRAVQTAQPIGQMLGLDPQPHPELRPWNLGQLQGQPSKEVAPMMDDLMKSGGAAAPGGESYHDFLNRYVPFVKSLIESPQHHVVVTHLRNMKVIEALAKTGGKGVDLQTLLSHKESVNPDPVSHITMGPDYKIQSQGPLVPQAAEGKQSAS